LPTFPRNCKGLGLGLGLVFTLPTSLRNRMLFEYLAHETASEVLDRYTAAQGDKGKKKK